LHKADLSDFTIETKRWAGIGRGMPISRAALHAAPAHVG
jgi:hypothetical protein